MPQIVNSGLVACFVVARNARFLAHSLKGLVRRVAFDLLSVLCQKEAGIVHRFVPMVLPMIFKQDFEEIGADRDFTRTVDAAAPNLNASSTKVYVFALQLKCLAEHRAGGIKKQEQGTKGTRMNHAVELALHSAGGRE